MRNEKVRESCVNMIVNGWIGENQEIVKLLESLDVEEFEEVSTMMLTNILPKLSISMTFDIDNLTNETSLFWRTYYGYCKEKEVCKFSHK